MLNRRSFVLSTGLAMSMFASPQRALAAQNLKKVAFIGTVDRTHSHVQHFLDRLTVGYAWGGRWQLPRVDVASVYLDQFPEADLGKKHIEQRKLRQCNSIAEALTLGGSKLAVDGVVIIGEHGDYPANDRGQRLYPRYRWFKEVVKVFEESGRSVPVFNDKHLSTSWSECREMVEDSKRLKFPFLAGSSLPVTWRLPEVEVAMGTPLRESVCVAYGGVDSYDFHALETAQCMSERRQGGEVGIRSVHALKGENLWRVLESTDRKDTQQLFVSALSRSHNLPVVDGYPTGLVSYSWAKEALPTTWGYLIEHLDGFRTSIFMTSIRDFNYAGLKQDGELIGCQMYLPMPSQSSTTADFFNPLVRHIEQMVLTGEVPYPVERTLLTSGMVIGGVESLHLGEKLFETKDMAVKYEAHEDSAFWHA